MTPRTVTDLLDTGVAGTPGEASHHWQAMTATGLVRSSDGDVHAPPVWRWLGPTRPEEAVLLAEAVAPVIDIGCGPGRHVVSLLEAGLLAVGLDVAEEAVQLARSRGALVAQGCVFGDVPAAGQWRTALLIDGNVGIGGDPAALLRRLREVLTGDGRVLVEVERRGVGLRITALSSSGAAEPSFPWAHVGIDALDQIATAAGFVIVESWEDAGRCFARLDVAAT